jgi:hypothetical protein
MIGLSSIRAVRDSMDSSDCDNFAFIGLPPGVDGFCIIVQTLCTCGESQGFTQASESAREVSLRKNRTRKHDF